MAVISVLGGGSPYTLNLLSELGRVLPDDVGCEIRLYGRNRRALGQISHASAAIIGRPMWSVSGTTEIQQALHGADIVVHQIRYGGLEGREADELFAQEIGISPDETIGACGLKAAIRVTPDIIELAKMMAAHCPDAWLLNLSNPLSLSTAVFVHAGLKKALGVCELPLATHRQVANAIGMPPHLVDWQYTGLNHRGFLHSMKSGQQDLFELFIRSLNGRPFNDIPVDELIRLGAIPLKYWRLFLGKTVSHIGRSRELISLNSAIFKELDTAPSVLPASLSARATPWYSEAVVPLIRDLLSGAEGEHVLTYCRADDVIATEHKSKLKHGEVIPQDAAVVPVAVQESMRSLTLLERISLRAALEPTWRNIRDALSVDPLLPVGALDKALRLLVQA